MTYDFENQIYIPRSLVGVLGSNDLIVFSLLNQLQQQYKKDYAEASYSYLCKYSFSSKGGLRKCIKRLVDQGFIVVLEKGVGSNSTKFKVLKPFLFNEGVE